MPSIIELKPIAFVKNSRKEPTDDNWSEVISEIGLAESERIRILRKHSGKLVALNEGLNRVQPGRKVIRVFVSLVSKTLVSLNDYRIAFWRFGPDLRHNKRRQDPVVAGVNFYAGKVIHVIIKHLSPGGAPGIERTHPILKTISGCSHPDIVVRG